MTLPRRFLLFILVFHNISTYLTPLEWSNIDSLVNWIYKINRTLCDATRQPGVLIQGDNCDEANTSSCKAIRSSASHRLRHIREEPIYTIILKYSLKGTVWMWLKYGSSFYCRIEFLDWKKNGHSILLEVTLSYFIWNRS